MSVVRFEAYCLRCEEVIGAVSVDSGDPRMKQQKLAVLEGMVAAPHRHETMRYLADGSLSLHNVRVVPQEIRLQWQEQ